MSNFMNQGFTLAELLISLLILGEIATFSIPKILSAQQANTYNAGAMEFVGTISQAYQMMQMEGLVTDNTGPYSLMTYMNYTQFDTTASIDTEYGTGTQPCSPCLALHNGARAAFGNAPGFSFGGSGANNAIAFVYDPDGRITDGTTNGPGKSVRFLLFRNGRVTSAGQYRATVCETRGCYVAGGTDAPWLKW